MNNEHPFYPKEAANALGVCMKTIQRWDQAGKLRTVRAAFNQRRIPLKEIERLLRPGEPQAERCALYACVSSVRQDRDGNLARQTERLKEAASARSCEVVAVITEQASSLNEKRKGRNKLLALIEEPAVDVVLIALPDRLVRFSFSHPERAVSWKGGRLEVLDHPKAQELAEELVQNLLTIVSVFVGRLSGHRAKQVRKQVKTALAPCEQEEPTELR